MIVFTKLIEKGLLFDVSFLYYFLLLRIINLDKVNGLKYHSSAIFLVPTYLAHNVINLPDPHAETIHLGIIR